MSLKGIPLHSFGLEHVFLQVIKYVMNNLNVVQVGTIQNFNPLNQTAIITLNTKRLVATNPDTWESYPPLVDVPVLILGGGGGAITFPIKQGDECIILFNDRELDNWFQNGGVQTFSSQRTHDFSDGMAIVGLRSLPNVLSDYNTDGIDIRYNNVKFSFNDDSISLSVIKDNNSAVLTLGSGGLILTVDGIPIPLY
jgi:hypothetical protein